MKQDERMTVSTSSALTGNSEKVSSGGLKLVGAPEEITSHSLTMRYTSLKSLLRVFSSDEQVRQISKAQRNGQAALRARGPRANAYLIWINENYPLIDGDFFQQEYNKRSPRTPPIPAHSGTVAKASSLKYSGAGSHIYDQLRSEMLSQFEQFCDLARGDGERSALARQFLAHMVLSDGFPVFSLEREALADSAATMLGDLIKVEQFRTELYSSVAAVLSRCQPARESIRWTLLNALTQGKARRERTDLQLSATLLSSLHQELERPDSQRSVRFQCRLIELIKEHPNPEAVPILNAIAEHHPQVEVRETARLVKFYIHNSHRRIWDATACDELSRLDERARRLACTLADNDLTEVEGIQAVFNQLKGCYITDKNDPRLPYLDNILSLSVPASSQLTLGTALGIAYSYRIPELCQVAGKAIQVLVETAINGADPGAMLDALIGVKLFRQLSKTADACIEKSLAVANQTFVRHGLERGSERASASQ